MPSKPGAPLHPSVFTLRRVAKVLERMDVTDPDCHAVCDEAAAILRQYIGRRKEAHVQRAG